MQHTVALLHAVLESLPEFTHALWLILIRPPSKKTQAINLLTGMLSVRLFRVPLYMSLHSEEISMKLGTDIHRVSENCWKSFQGQSSKVKVIAGWNALFRQIDGRPSVVVWRRHIYRSRCGVEAYLSLRDSTLCTIHIFQQTLQNQPNCCYLFVRVNAVSSYSMFDVLATRSRMFFQHHCRETQENGQSCGGIFRTGFSILFRHCRIHKTGSRESADGGRRLTEWSL